MITSLYSGLLALLFLAISFLTIKARRKHKISLGYGPNNEIHAIVSAHSNFSAYAPFFLILLFLVEFSNQFPNFILHFIGLSFVVGRGFHLVAFAGQKMIFKARILGMVLTLTPTMALAWMNIYSFFKA